MSIATADPVEVMTKARLHLMFDARRMFFATLCFHLQPVLVEDEAEAKRIWRGQKPSMATDGKYMYYHREFFKSLDPTHGFQQLMGVLAHEGLHYGLGHMFRIGERDLGLWNIACISGKTKIGMADGSTKEVRNLSAGDHLAAYGTSTVTALLGGGIKPMIRLTLSSGHKLECTHEHKILTPVGFVKAGSIAVGTEVVVERQRQTDRTNQEACKETAKPDGYLSAGRRELPPAGQHHAVLQDQAGLQAGALQTSGGEVDCTGEVLPGWIDRRRGDGELHVSEGEGREILYPDADHLEYMPAHDGMAGEPGIFGSPGEKQPWQLLLQGRSRRRDLRPGPTSSYAVLDYEERAGRNLPEVSRLAEEARTSLLAHIRDALSGRKVSAFEQAWVEQVEELPAQECYDLTTTGGHYIANGVVVHNCDIIINHHVKAAGMMLPADHVHIDDQRVRDMFKPLPSGVTWAQVAAEWDAEQIFHHFDDKKCGGKQQMPQWGIILKPQGQDGGDAEGEELEGMKASARDAFVQAAATAKMAGNMPGSLEGQITEMTKPQVDWRAVLQNFVASAVPYDYSWKRPSRRLVSRNLYLPSANKRNFGTICLFIDTSGSVSDRELEQFLGEINNLTQLFQFEQVVVVPCDYAVQVQGIQRYKRGEVIKTLRCDGRGGTSFCPPFEWLEKNQDIKPMRIVYFTDMEGQFPPPYKVPTLWVATTKLKAPWGQTVQIEVGR